MGANLALTLADVLSFILNLVQILVIASIIVSWIGDRHNQIVMVIEQITEPIYRPFRPLARMIPGPLDWTPIIIFIAIIIVEGIVVNGLKDIAGG